MEDDFIADIFALGVEKSHNMTKEPALGVPRIVLNCFLTF